MKKIIKLTENQLHKIIKESVNKIINEDIYDNMYNLHDFNHFNNDDIDEYYTAFVVINGSDGALISNYDEQSMEDAIEEARELARNNKYGTYYVCGVDNNDEYSSDPEDNDNTIVYCTDEEF